METLIEKLEQAYKRWCDIEDNAGLTNPESTATSIDARGRTRGLKESIDIVKEHQGINGSDPYETGFYDGVQDKERHNSNWVSVSEGLPSDGDIVEVYRHSYKWGDLVWQCLYIKERGFINYPVDGIGKNEKITHWREIQPPSEVQDD